MFAFQYIEHVWAGLVNWERHINIKFEVYTRRRISARNHFLWPRPVDGKWNTLTHRFPPVFCRTTGLRELAARILE